MTPAIPNQVAATIRRLAHLPCGLTDDLPQNFTIVVGIYKDLGCQTLRASVTYVAQFRNLVVHPFSGAHCELGAFVLLVATTTPSLWTVWCSVFRTDLLVRDQKTRTVYGINDEVATTSVQSHLHEVSLYAVLDMTDSDQYHYVQAGYMPKSKKLVANVL